MRSWLESGVETRAVRDPWAEDIGGGGAAVRFIAWEEMWDGPQLSRSARLP